jgi:RNA polymerase sigma-70 factor (ECF subfamily)
MRRRLPQELHDWIEIVVEDNADDLLRYLQRRVDPTHEAADLLGSVLLALGEHGARVPTDDEDARMWCFGVARNVLREHYRHAARRVTLADALREHLRVSAEQDNAADSAAEGRIRDEAVRNAVVALDKRSRELVMLVHWDGFRIAEAARLLSMNESTARTRYGRALRRLERVLGERPSSAEVDGARREPGLRAGAR